ncbi:hypothetical protein ABZ478_00185 [Streptomyces sp. NPDC005706]|uniref:hypothetical protein n=1 Tax=Streptomyces sp. NPDC005706 TaxID=3157169 RepID=UPI003404E2CD
MKEWREDAQPEWPQVASAPWQHPVPGHTRAFPETGALRGGGHADSSLPHGGHPAGTAFPETGDVPGAGAFPATGILRGGRAARTEADGTAVLPRARDDRAAADFRRAPDRGATAAPDPEQTTVLRRVRVGGHTGPGTAESLRDPWGEPLPSIPTQPTASDPTHDPHEVTVQMEAVQLGDGRLTAAPGTTHGTGRETADGPVFVDESGRRSRTFRRLGVIVGLACAGYAVVIVATLFSGSSDAPWVPVPGQDENAPASQVDSPPLPSVSADPAPESGGPAATPVVSPTASAGTAPGAGSLSSSAPGTSRTSADAAPTAGTSAGVVGGTRHPSTSPASPAGSSPDPSTPGTGASPGPSLSPAGGTGPEAHSAVGPTVPRPHL